uniref:DNA-directed RNA polymerase n=1 Tax=Pithovirus LCPAC404 TaxID=2506597 RepID=A0A481ZC88_9VIRU|nr:MAG: DNA-directed RNA polymerase subunit beta [Pithovirus LCPAC404]
MESITDEKSIEPTIETINLFQSSSDEDVSQPFSVTSPQDSTLMKTLYNYNGFTGYIISQYNSWVDDKLPKQISRKIAIPGVGILELHNGRLDGKPMIQDTQISQKREYLPLEARYSGGNYVGKLYVDVKLIDNNGNLIAEQTRILAGEIPIMLGSNKCHLSSSFGRAKELELVRDYGECMRDSFGYFIMKGMEKMLLLQQHLRKHIMITYQMSGSGDVISKMTCDTDRGSREVWLIEENKALRVSLNSIFPSYLPERVKPEFANKKGGIPIFIFIRYLLTNVRLSGSEEKSDVDEHNTQNINIDRNHDIDEKQIFDEIISPFIYTAKEKDIVWRALRPSREESRICHDPVAYIEDRINPRQEKIDPSMKSIQYQGIVLRELFPNIIGGTLDLNGGTITLAERKMYQLGILIVKMAKYINGSTPIDDWDNWGLKRVDSAAVIMEQLFTEIVDVYANTISLKITKKRSTDPNSIFNSVSEAAGTITGIFSESFSSNLWGTTRKPKENVVEQLKRDTMLAVYAQITRINAPTIRRAKQPAIRQLQMSQLGYVGIADSPEGSSCGLVKAIASTASLSVGTTIKSKRLCDLLSEECSKYGTPDRVNGCMYNGEFVGWCVAKDLRDKLVKLRRSLTISYDTCIYINQMNILGIWTDGSRLIRPLLIVDSDDGELVINKKWKDRTGKIKKNMWTEDMKTLLRNGAVEYIDSLEQQDTVIAQTIPDLYNEKKEYELALRNATDAINSEKGLIEIMKRQGQQISEELASRLQLALEDRTKAFRIRKDIRELEEKVENPEWNEDLIDAIRLAEATMTELSLKTHRKYTHTEYDPTALFGIAGSVIPFIGHTQAPRNTYQCAMGKQSLGLYHSNRDLRMENMKALAHPARPQITTSTAEILGFGTDPSGENVIVAIMPYGGYDQEDGLILNQRSIDLGLFTTVIYHVYTSTRKQQVGTSSERFKYHPSHRKDEKIYHALAESGIPKMGSYVTSGDCIIGKIREDKVTKIIADASTYVKPGEQGEVDRVSISTGPTGLRVVNVRIKHVKVPEIGDKFASRYAQKSTVTKILAPEDMPYTQGIDTVTRTFIETEKIDVFGLPSDAENDELEHRYLKIMTANGNVAIYTEDEPGIAMKTGTDFDLEDCIIAKKTVDGSDASIYALFGGTVVTSDFNTETRKLRMVINYKLPGSTVLVPDVIISPAAIPSRMTVGMLFEMVASKFASITGDRINADAFRKFDLDTWKSTLRAYGYDDMGYHRMINGMTGLPINAKIFVGICYYQVLRHMVESKFQVRSRGATKAATRQPTSGRKRRGGQKFSSMSTSAMLSQGASAVLHDRACISSDYQQTVVCTNCASFGTAVAITPDARCSGCSSKKLVLCSTGFSMILFSYLLLGSGVNVKMRFKEIKKE